MKILQLKIGLNGIKPAIWRRFLVEDSISFHELHGIIQIVMGWENYHLYEFEVDDTRIEASSKGFFVDAVWIAFRPKAKKTKPATKTRLNDFIKTEKQRFYYLYDFGDKWEHAIRVEKILEKDDSQKYPVCIAGKRACPPEDCGGVWGYQELMEIRKDKNHPEYEERIVEWLGEDFDPEHFDVDEINRLLK
ncbi:MAG: plasmid pRiA4b ORF-3 family protein [Candidatus Thermoplasmatota archaeon]|nr:plasmid pRiA4b ORF-3 family protein [Candidatus Thermoplasmatota archaeon]